MTPKPRLMLDFARESGWKDYSINKRKARNSHNEKKTTISKSKESSSIMKKGMISPRAKSKIKIKIKEVKSKKKL